MKSVVSCLAVSVCAIALGCAGLSGKTPEPTVAAAPAETQVQTGEAPVLRLNTVEGDARLLRRVDLASRGVSVYRGSVDFGDLDGDGELDLLISRNAQGLVGYSIAKDAVLWEVVGPAEMPPAPQKYRWKFVAWDFDRDGADDVVGPFATAEGRLELRLLSGRDGKALASAPLPYAAPRTDNDVQEWRLYLAVADLSGAGFPNAVLLQTESDSHGELYAFDAALRPLWDTSGDARRFIGGHFPWAADVDGDGADEVIGRDLLASDGTTVAVLTNRIVFGKYFDHVDRAFFADFDLELPGKELLVSHEYLPFRLLRPDGTMIRELIGEKDAKIDAVGDFLPDRPGYEVLIQDPALATTYALLAGNGERIAFFESPDLLPDGYGIEWDGEPGDELFCPRKFGDLLSLVEGTRVSFRSLYERDRGSVPVLVPGAADARYSAFAADLLGDGREEIVLMDDDELLIYGSRLEPASIIPPRRLDPSYRRALANSENDNHPERTIYPDRRW